MYRPDSPRCVRDGGFVSKTSYGENWGRADACETSCADLKTGWGDTFTTSTGTGGLLEVATCFGELAKGAGFGSSVTKVAFGALVTGSGLMRLVRRVTSVAETLEELPLTVG